MNLDLIREEIGKVIPVIDGQFRDFAKMLKVVRLDKGQIWERKDKVSLNMAFVNKGTLRQYVQKEGDEFIEQFYLRGDFLGNYRSYHLQTVSSSYIQAIEKCELLTIPFERLDCLMGLSRNIEEFSRHLGNKKLFELEHKYSRLLCDSPEERYVWLLKTQPYLLKKIPQYYIAQYLGVKPETLSRIKKRFV
ncbi:MAG: Crp/Fnr family transcriptional regulator [Bacteroidota bacterium]